MQMKLFGRIEKVVPLDDGTVRVHGIASSEAVDDQNEIVRGSAIRDALPNYMKFPALRSMHQLDAAGTTLEAEVGKDDVTRIVAHVVDPVAVLKVKNNVFRGFSIGGRVTQRDPANNKCITGLVLSEISLVDRPANAEAIFDCWKASDMPDIQAATAAPFNPPIQIWACDDPTHRHVAKAEAVKCLEEKHAAGAEEPNLAERQTQENLAVDTAQPDSVEKQAVDGAASAQALIDAALKAIEEGEEALAKAEPDAVVKDDGGGDMGEAAKDGDKPYGDVAYADNGLQADGKKRYPIDTEAHIRAAWNYINKPKNCAKYGDNCSKVKAKIVSAWKSKIDKDGPPSAKTATTAAKSLWDIGEVAMLIAGLRTMCERLELERAMEGDDSALPESCEAVCASACSLLMAMCAEETQEVLNDTEIDEPVGPQMSAMMMSAIAESLAKANPDDTEKVEQLMDTLGKANRRHRAEVQAQLDGAAYATNKALEVGKLRRAEMISAGDAHKAVLDAGAVAWGSAITGREMLRDGNPSGDPGQTTHATTDTGGNGMTSVPNPTGASPASPFPKVSKTDLIDEIEGMIKANAGGKALLMRAHDLICSASNEATCNEDVEKPAHLSGRDMASLHRAHHHLMAVEGITCAASVAAEAAAKPAGEAEALIAIDTAKAADAAPEAPASADELLGDWGKTNTPVPAEVWRVERDDLAKALASERTEKGELLKTIGAIVPMLDRLTKRVDQIADTPFPPKAVSNSAVFSVNKAQDGGALGGQPDRSLPLEQRLTPELREAFTKLSAEDQTMLKIRDQLGQPIAYDPIRRVLAAG